MAKTVVVGSGISGLFACLYLVEKGIRDILVVEQSSQLGGALKCFDYGEYGKFDQGMHNILLPGVNGVDKLLLPFVTTSEWHPLSGNRRDLCGAYWNNKLQTESPYPQIFRLSDEIISQGLRDFFPAIAKPVSEVATAKEYFDSRFGKSFSEKLFCPIVEKIHKRKADELHFSAASIVPLTRISFDDNNFSEVVLGSEALRSVISWPQQRTLPLQYSSGRSAYYPRRYGMHYLIDEIVASLREKGCDVLTSTKVSSLSVHQGKISEIAIVSNGVEQKVSVDHVIWSAGQIPLLRSLNIPINLPFEKAQRTYLANLILKNLPRMDDLYYTYVYDPKFQSFRITNYKQFSPDCDRAGGVPVSVEVLSDEEFSPTGIVELAMSELVEMDLCNKDDLIWGRGEIITEGGFPLPSTLNVDSLGKVRDLIQEQGITNLLNVGIQSSPNTFFQTDVILDTFSKLELHWT